MTWNSWWWVNRLEKCYIRFSNVYVNISKLNNQIFIPKNVILASFKNQDLMYWKTIWILLEQTPYQYELDDEEDKTFLKSIDSIYFCISVKIILPKPQLAVSWTYTPSFDIYMSKVGPKSVSSYQDSISFILVYNGERGAMIDVGMIKNAKYFRVLFNLILYPRTKGSY